MLIMIIFIIALIPNALPHLDAGEDKVVGEYLVDFSYSPKEPSIDDKAAMAFSLLNNTNREVIEPESVWIRLSSSKEVVFAGTLKQESGNVAFTYKFPYADDYIITARYKDSEKTIVETDFNIKIKESVPVYYYVLGIIVTLILIFVVMKFNSLNKKLKKLDAKS
ncbi:MAG: hypothetical protein AABX63_04085 [Nanoarchaeota archaeon]